jgi:hypothetical protein
MRLRDAVAIALLFAVASTQEVPAADKSLPWAFNAPAADGYSIKLIAVEPTPGTPLARGTQVSFKISLSYTMSVANHGRIILVFQDEKNGRVDSDVAQVSQEVSSADGMVSLEQTVTIPARAKELRLFIPLVPDGLIQTTGEVTLRYPIVKKGK